MILLMTTAFVVVLTSLDWQINIVLISNYFVCDNQKQIKTNLNI